MNRKTDAAAAEIERLAGVVVLANEMLSNANAAMRELRVELEQASADRAALIVAITGLRKMRDYYQEGSTPTVDTYVVGRDLSMMLSKIEAQR